MTQQSIVKEEEFEINRNTPGLSETDISVVAGEGQQDIWQFKVPAGWTIVFIGEDTFAAYLENGSSAEVAAGSSVAVDKTDASQQAREPLLNQLRYAQVKNFQDVDKLVTLDIEPGQRVVVNENEYVIIKGNVNTDLDASDSYFALTCKRIRRTLF